MQTNAQAEYITLQIASQVSETIEYRTSNHRINRPAEKLQRLNREPLATCCASQIYQEQPHSGGWMVHFVVLKSVPEA